MICKLCEWSEQHCVCTQESVLDSFKRDCVELGSKYTGKLVICFVGQQITPGIEPDAFTCSGQLVMLDNHITAGPEALCNAHEIMHATMQVAHVPGTIKKEPNRCH